MKITIELDLTHASTSAFLNHLASFGLKPDVQPIAESAKPTTIVIHKETPVTKIKHIEAPIVPNEKETSPAPVFATDAISVPGATPTEIPYAEVSKAVLDFIKNKEKGGKPRVLEIMASFGVATAPELKAEHYADFIKMLSHALAA